MTLTVLDRDEALAPDVLARMRPIWEAADAALRTDEHLTADLAEMARDAVVEMKREAEARARREAREAAEQAIRDAARVARARERDERRAERERVIEERRAERARLREERRIQAKAVDVQTASVPPVAVRKGGPTPTPEERELRAAAKLARRREADRAKRAAMTPERRAAYNADQVKRRANRTPEQRAQRREYARAWQANRTPEQIERARASSLAWHHRHHDAAASAPDLDALIAAGEV
ncbi:hypothetical protein [Microbacterium proteolyticum]|uniref:hypothetical protein n=1 Tax=Microbacterium proteolyticum TaxID=1572644 RepID=UPI001FAE5636|nr:hypothetical protein [Microbacterium proteolyticum]MCI9856787.1 hypothetical protein [Microbacterium proteolyticum]